ncbi:MAG: 50S ribosomal protein L24 [Myxococcales bacterium]|nr:50S ribosomal protein L24 [Myxococcales bacterium]
MRKIRKGDKVAIIAGKDKGQTGTVLRMARDGEAVIVEGQNMMRKHVKARREGEEGGIKDREAPLHVSNVALISPTTGKPVRVGFQTVETAKGPQKVRVVHKTGEVIDPVQ